MAARCVGSGNRESAVLRQREGTEAGQIKQDLGRKGVEANFLYLLLPVIVLVFLSGEREMAPIPLLTTYKMGRFDLSHRSVTIYSKLSIFLPPKI